MAVLGLGVLTMSVLGPIMPLYLTSIEVSPEILGLMFSVAMVGMVIGESSWGWVADKVGLKIPLNIGTFLCAGVVLLFIVTEKVPAIFLIFFFWGIVRSALIGPCRGYIGANAPPLRRATFMAIIAAMLAASRSLGALPSGFIVDTWGYNAIFFVSCGIALLGGFIVVVGLRKIRLFETTRSANVTSPGEELASLGQGFKYRSFTPQCMVTFLEFLGLGVSIAFLPLLATQVVGVGATEVGILFTIRGLAAMILSIPMGTLADRKGKRALMIVGLLISAAAMAGMAFVQSFLWLIASAIFQSLGFAMFSPAALGLLSDSVPLHRQSTAMGIYGGVCENTGIIAGSALGGFIWSAWGPRPTFLMGSIAAGLGAMTCLSLVREKFFKNL